MPVYFMQMKAKYIIVSLFLSSGCRVPAFEHVLEVSPGDADKLSNMMKYYKKMGHIRAHRRLYSLVKKNHHKDKMCVYVWCVYARLYICQKFCIVCPQSLSLFLSCSPNYKVGLLTTFTNNDHQKYLKPTIQILAILRINI